MVLSLPYRDPIHQGDRESFPPAQERRRPPGVDLVQRVPKGRGTLLRTAPALVRCGSTDLASAATHRKSLGSFARVDPHLGLYRPSAPRQSATTRTASATLRSRHQCSRFVGPRRQTLRGDLLPPQQVATAGLSRLRNLLVLFPAMPPLERPPKTDVARVVESPTPRRIRTTV